MGSSSASGASRSGGGAGRTIRLVLICDSRSVRLPTVSYRCGVVWGVEFLLVQLSRSEQRD